MVEGKLDVIIFGATGFTGKYVVREFVKIAHEKYSWGIAGRNKEKLEEVLKETSTTTGKDILTIPIIIADCKDTESINNMTEKARVIVNCCGPYQLYGEVVVKSCVENGCHHVDVSGEPQYMELMQYKYNDDAGKNGVYIISACGFDSVPNDLGVVHFMKIFDGIVNSVESYMKFKLRGKIQGPTVNYGTWESAINSVANVSNRKEIREKLFPKDQVPVLTPKLKRRAFVHRSELSDNKLCIPFLGADASVVKRTQFLLYTLQKQRPVQFHPFFVCRDLLTLAGLMIVGLFIGVLSRVNFGVKLLLSYPKIFTFGLITGEEPSLESVDNSAAVITFRGEGWSSESVQNIEDKTTISLPTNKTINMEISFDSPGYGFTSKALILSALTILDEGNKLPAKGGVYTPGSAFYNTTYLNRLVDNGLRITVNK